MNNKELHYIMSINVIAYMKANGIESIGEPQKTDDGKVKYFFEPTKKFKELLSTYNNDEFIQRFIGKLRQTKSEMHNIKNR